MLFVNRAKLFLCGYPLSKIPLLKGVREPERKPAASKVPGHYLSPLCLHLSVQKGHVLRRVPRIT